MSQPTRTEAIKRVLEASTHPDLAALYNYNLEVQVNVAQDGGERLDKTFNGRTFMSWTDGLEIWKPFRIPRNAGTNPEYTDVPMSFNLEAHYEGIGLTGWDWANQVSKWVAFDFDAIVGHSEQHTKRLTDEELQKIRILLQNIPWVTLRYSTSGKGLHLYIFLDDIPTANHHEHAALARSILGQLSAFVGFNFSAKVDVCGGIMWILHRKMKGTNGLQLIKQGDVFTDVPSNWRDHVAVIRGDRRKTLPTIVQKGTEEDLFEELTSKSTLVELDSEHRAHIDWLATNGHAWYWDNDRNMLVTHTWSLKRMYEELQLRGPFETISTGTERGADYNCYLFPMRKGSWAVRRFTPGVAEHASWSQDGAGWTRCFLNRDPDLRTLASSNGANEKPNGGYLFSEAQAAIQTAVALGAEVNLPNHMMSRKTTLKERKDKKLIIEVERDASDDGGLMREWIPEGKKWQKVLSVRFSAPLEAEVGDFDELVRHLVSPEHIDAGWSLRAGSYWTDEPMAHVTKALKSQGHKNDEIDIILGSAVLKHWVLTNVPFGPEYPGGRYWNRSSAQFAFKPTQDKENLSYPTWLKMLNHLGQGLDEEIKDHPWAINNGILTGGDYLKVWIASLFQKPLEQLPYLFFYSQEQNAGKSTFHEAISLCLSHGSVVAADKALVSEGSFNAELASAILCVVEEVDLGQGRGKSLAYNRIKEWVTAKTFQVHGKGKTPYSIPNSTHFVQCANNHNACPILPGDSRITMINVSPIDPLELIPKGTLLEELREEAPDFLAAVLALDIPPSNDRLNVPVVTTQIKESVSRSNMTLLENFIAEECFEIDGELMKFSEFYDRFLEWLGSMEDKTLWTKHKVRNEIPPRFVYGVSYKNNQRYIGNISFQPRNGEVKAKITVRNGKLYHNGGPI